MKNLLTSLFLTGLISVLPAGESKKLDVYLTPDGEIFKTVKPETLIDQKKDFTFYTLFKWTSDKQTEARYPGWSNSPELTFQGFPLQEAIFRFKEDKLDSIYMSIYNRGDAGKLTIDDFQKLIGELDAKLSGLSGQDGTEQKSKLTSKAENYQKVWVKEPLAYILKWSISGKSKKNTVPEYIQLTVEEFDPKNDPRKQSITAVDKKDIKSSKNLVENIVKEEDGTVFLDNIPMVDQGQKGYCAVAVAERVIRYYGNEDVTQHTIAQLAGSGAEQGTSRDAMIESLKKVGPKLGVKVRERYTAYKNVNDIEKFLSKYNRTAKKMKKNKVEMVVRDRVVYLDETMSQLDPEVYKACKASESADFRKFCAFLKESISKGIPVIWCVTLGIVEEQGLPQTRGGHMRLLTGYNEKEKSIVYSDTWGSGHEKKKMPMEDAWTITDATLTLEPRAAK